MTGAGFALWRGSPNHYQGRNGLHVDHITLHIMVGRLAGTDSCFMRSSFQAASHYGVGGDGSVYDAMAAAFTGITAYSFLVFNLLCAPCFAAIGAIKREMNSRKWTWFAIGYQCVFAYVIALMINQFGNLFTGNANILGVIVAVLLLAGIIYMLCKPYKEATKLSVK